MPSSRQIISDFIKRGYIQPTQINKALTCTQVSPTINQWFQFLDRLLLCLGALSIGFATLFFIAYNWDEWGRFAKFALIESILMATVFIYWRVKHSHLTRQVTLLVSCLMVGVLMAFYGQTYQTGADPWTLFFYWAVLISPWVVIARFAPLWLSWLGLLNVAVSLYIDSFGLPFRLFSSDQSGLWISLFLLNCIALITLELNSRRFSYLSPRWLARTIASLAGLMITLTLIEGILNSIQFGLFSVLCWCLFIVALYVVYRRLRADLFMLAGGCLSFIVITITFCIRHLADGMMTEALFLVIAAMIIGLTSVATFWLKKVYKEML